MTTKTVNAAVYCRLSKDRSGAQISEQSARQERDCRKLCERRGWGVAEVFVDDDISAWSGKRRPGYEAMLQGVRDGRFQAVVSYDLDRLHRRPIELERFFEVCDQAGVTNLATVAGDVNLATDNGRLMARIMGAVAKKSSDDTSRRNRRQIEDRAAAGLDNGGPRAFGYERGCILNETEARMIRKAVADRLNGVSLYEITRQWNEAGVLTPRGNQWTVRSVTWVLLSPRLAGLRTSGERIIGKAAWPAIIDMETHHRIVATHHKTPAGRRTPFSGLFVCGLCGTTMVRSGTQGYKCYSQPGRSGCGKVNVTRAIEGYVTERVLSSFDAAALPVSVHDDGETVAELTAIGDRLNELTDLYATREIDKATWIRGRRTLEAQRDALSATLSRLNRPRAVTTLLATPGALRDSWERLSDEQKRAVLHSVILRVAVAPSGKRVPWLDTSRVVIEWSA